MRVIKTQTSLRRKSSTDNPENSQQPQEEVTFIQYKNNPTMYNEKLMQSVIPPCYYYLYF